MPNFTEKNQGIGYLPSPSRLKRKLKEISNSRENSQIQESGLL